MLVLTKRRIIGGLIFVARSAREAELRELRESSEKMRKLIASQETELEESEALQEELQKRLKVRRGQQIMRECGVLLSHLALFSLV